MKQAIGLLDSLGESFKEKINWSQKIKKGIWLGGEEERKEKKKKKKKKGGEGRRENHLGK